MKKIYCDRCGIEDGEVKVGGVSFYATDFPIPGKPYNRTDLSITKELCEKCAEKISAVVNNFFKQQDANTKTEEPEAGKISRHKTHDGIKASGEVR